jgi:hypothetical protein
MSRAECVFTLKQVTRHQSSKGSRRTLYNFETNARLYAAAPDLNPDAPKKLFHKWSKSFAYSEIFTEFKVIPLAPGGTAPESLELSVFAQLGKKL